MQDTQLKKDWQDLSMLKAIQYLRLLMKLMYESFRLRIITSPPTAPYLGLLSSTLHSSTVARGSSLVSESHTWGRRTKYVSLKLCNNLNFFF